MLDIQRKIPLLSLAPVVEVGFRGVINASVTSSTVFSSDFQNLAACKRTLNARVVRHAPANTNFATSPCLRPHLNTSDVL